MCGSVQISTRQRTRLGIASPANVRIEVNQDRVEGLLKQLSGGAKACWGALTGDPVTIAAGTRDRLAGRIQVQRGISKQAADRQLADFLYRNRKWSNLSKH